MNGPLWSQRWIPNLPHCGPCTFFFKPEISLQLWQYILHSFLSLLSLPAVLRHCLIVFMVGAFHLDGTQNKESLYLGTHDINRPTPAWFECNHLIAQGLKIDMDYTQYNLVNSKTAVYWFKKKVSTDFCKYVHIPSSLCAPYLADTCLTLLPGILLSQLYVCSMKIPEMRSTVMKTCLVEVSESVFNDFFKNEIQF